VTEPETTAPTGPAPSDETRASLEREPTVVSAPPSTAGEDTSGRVAASEPAARPAPPLSPLEAGPAPGTAALARAPKRTAPEVRPAPRPAPRDARGFPIGPYTFADEGGFAADVGRAVLGASGGALLASMLSGQAKTGFVWLVALALTGALAAIGARTGGLWRALHSAAFGVIGGWLFARALEWPILSAVLVGAAAAPVLARGETTEKVALTGAVTSLFVLGGAYVSYVLESTGVLAGLLSPMGATAAAGGALGLFVGLGSVPRHVVRSDEPVEAAYERALAAAHGEVREILERSLSIYRLIRADLGTRTGSKTEVQLGTRVSDLALRILEIGEQCRAIEADLGTAPAQQLEDRIAGLRRKAETTSDASARATFLATIDSLDTQKKAVEAIGRGLERVVARLHANVALLEKVRFSLVHARSASAERSGSEASPLTDTIDELSRELDATSTAMGEVYGQG
jgi:hypothetical protein